MSESVNDPARWVQLNERLAEFERRLLDGFAIGPEERTARLRERQRFDVLGLAGDFFFQRTVFEPPAAQVAKPDGATAVELPGSPGFAFDFGQQGLPWGIGQGSRSFLGAADARQARSAMMYCDHPVYDQNAACRGNPSSASRKWASSSSSSHGSRMMPATSMRNPLRRSARIIASRSGRRRCVRSSSKREITSGTPAASRTVRGGRSSDRGDGHSM